MKRHPSYVKLLCVFALACKLVLKVTRVLHSYSVCVCVRHTSTTSSQLVRCEIDCLCSPALSRAAPAPTDSSPPSVSTHRKFGSLLPNADLAVTHLALLPPYRPFSFLLPLPPLPTPHSPLAPPGSRGQFCVIKSAASAVGMPALPP